MNTMNFAVENLKYYYQEETYTILMLRNPHPLMLSKLLYILICEVFFLLFCLGFWAVVCLELVIDYMTCLIFII